MVEHEIAAMDQSDGREENSDDDSVVYLNNAGQAPLSAKVTAAGRDAVTLKPWEMHANNDQECIRSLFASLIHADPKRIAMMPSTAFAISLAAANIQQMNKKGKILVLQDQMCSAVYPWEHMCQESNGNITLDIVPYPTATEDRCTGWTNEVLSRLDDDVLVACLPQLHWSDGALLDLVTIGAACRLHDTMLIVDATQSVGIMPFDINQFQPTLVACSAHKWLRGPSGLSLVYISKEVQDSWQPLDQHGRSRAIAVDHCSSWDASKNEMGPDGYPAEFCKDARKFDSGGKPNPYLLPMIRAGLEKVVQLNVNDAQDFLRELTHPIHEWAAANGYCLTPGPHVGHLIGIRPCSGNALTPNKMVKIVEKLQEEGIYIAVRCGAFRISPYMDTTSADVRRLLDALARHCG